MSEYNGLIGHLTGVESPWGNAGGVVKTLVDVERMARTGVGWIEAGSYTLEMRPGNAIDPDHPELGEQFTVYYHDPETGETFNSLGMPNKGFDKVELEIPDMVSIAHANNKKLLVNVAPVSSDPVAELQELVSRAYAAGADGVIVNAGCPNVVTADGGRHEILSYKPNELFACLKGLKKVIEKYKPVLVRLSPYPDHRTMMSASQALWISDVVSAVFEPNTWGGHKPVDIEGNPILQVKGNIGGKSGPAMADAAYEQAVWLAQYLRGTKVDIISSSGIMNARELRRRLDIEGVVGGAGTTFYYESSNGWKEDTDKMLTDLAA